MSDDDFSCICEKKCVSDENRDGDLLLAVSLDERIVPFVVLHSVKFPLRSPFVSVCAAYRPIFCQRKISTLPKTKEKKQVNGQQRGGKSEGGGEDGRWSLKNCITFRSVFVYPSYMRQAFSGPAVADCLPTSYKF